VNVNTAPPEVLTALLEEENESLVKEIMSYTRRDYFKDMAEFAEKTGEHVPASFKARIGVGSDSFQIVSEGLVNNSRKQIQAFLYIDDKANVKILYWRNER
jgi:type II secretory pathway component PulK